MELYEKNYCLIRLLVPTLRTLAGQPSADDQYVSEVDGCLDLELRQIEQSRYTTTFNLTYRFGERHHRTQFEPDLTIRLYHDARTCEVVTGLVRTTRSDLRRSRNLEESLRLNRFLHRWLTYCLRQGHSFSEASIRGQYTLV